MFQHVHLYLYIYNELPKIKHTVPSSLSLFCSFSAVMVLKKNTPSQGTILSARSSTTAARGRTGVAWSTSTTTSTVLWTSPRARLCWPRASTRYVPVCHTRHIHYSYDDTEQVLFWRGRGRPGTAVAGEANGKVPPRVEKTRASKRSRGLGIRLVRRQTLKYFISVTLIFIVYQIP